MKTDQSFGVVPLKRRDNGWYVFLIQHKKSHHWGLPKGHKELLEDPFDAAFRELKEETHLECDQLLQKEPLVEEYDFFLDGEKIHKTVFYFVAEVVGEVSLQEEEVLDGVWLDLSSAIEKITYLEGKKILSQVLRILLMEY